MRKYDIHAQWNTRNQKEILSPAAAWMRLEDIILGDQNQVHKEILHAESKQVNLIEVESRTAVTRGWGRVNSCVLWHIS
jgi:hypothetical protein